MGLRHSILPFILFFTLSCTQKRKTTTGEIKIPKNELRGALDAFNTAFANGDLVVLDSLTTENYLHTNGSSKAIAKTDWFNYLRKRNQQLTSDNLEILDYSLDEQKIEFHGTTAIVTGKVRVGIKDSLGIKQTQYRITNVLVFDEGQWKRAGFHDGKIQ